MINNLSSCAIIELSGLFEKEPESLVGEISNYHFKDQYCDSKTFVIFSDNMRNQGGKKLAAYIQENNLGDVLETEERVNTRYGRDGSGKIKLWVWTINHYALAKWAERNPQKDSPMDIYKLRKDQKRYETDIEKVDIPWEKEKKTTARRLLRRKRR